MDCGFQQNKVSSKLTCSEFHSGFPNDSFRLSLLKIAGTTKQKDQKTIVRDNLIALKYTDFKIYTKG